VTDSFQCKELGATVESLCSLGLTLQCPAFSARWGTPLVKFWPDACNQQVHHTTLTATNFPHPIRSKQKCVHGGGGGGGGHLKRVQDINKLLL